MPGVPALAIEEIDYPESDGQPVAETQTHFNELVDEVKQLEIYFRDEPDVWVAGNLFVYFRQGDPKAVAAPTSWWCAGSRRRSGASTCSGRRAWRRRSWSS